ncbi:peptidoglycan-recognition protein SC1a/b-like isoform X2 [Anthonomus grandis grandis]|uniref:peptidoglycan-recognition protein SC1a/b-like isoform X2 n=1 Tax=Anthonomus grandis grandis TaxID=2921223 RepID=UPI002166358C|nr:peptidoglycan-recognition protein SC1a/b-like isoform X2 [Anthonomus grandis grandis]
MLVKSLGVNKGLEKADQRVPKYDILEEQKFLIYQQQLVIKCIVEQLNSQDPTPCKSISISDRLKQFLKDKPTQFWLAGVLLALMIISSIVLFFCLYKFNEGAPVGPPTFGHGDDLGDGIQVINREEWLARAPRHIKKLKGPLKMVRIMHTAGAFCKDYQKCASQVQTLQGWQVSQFDMPDIAYNYLIGGDGNVYVGRGPEVENQWQKNAYDIVYLGNYLGPYDQLSDKMETAGKRIIARLRNEGYLTPDYIVIAQNQTFNTLSPGENIFKKIVKWPHYDPGPHFNETET